MPRSENLTILLSDIVGFTERTSRQSRRDTDRLLRDHNNLLPPLATRFSGRVIKSMGDAFLITFRSPTDAVRCAMAFQDAVTEFNRSRPPNQQFHIRVALNVGEVRIADGDVHGDAVNVAARVEAFTPVDDIYITEALYLVMNRVEVQAELVGEKSLRGVPDPVQVYRVLPRPAGNGAIDSFAYGGMHRLDSEPDAPVSRRNLTMLLVLAAAIAVSGGVVWWLVWQSSDRGGVATETSPEAAVPSEPVELASQEPFTDSPANLTPPGTDTTTPQPSKEQLSPSSQLDLAQKAITAGDLTAADRLLSDILSQQPEHAEALLLSGHVAFARKDRSTGISFYKRALAVDPELKENQELADNLVSALGWVSKPAGDLLSRYPSQPAVSALARRTARAGIKGRHQAVALLESMGYTNRIDRFRNAVLDLAEEPECSGRRDAVLRLRRLADKRALPALREAVALKKSNLRNACLFVDAKAAIMAIEGGDLWNESDRP